MKKLIFLALSFAIPLVCQAQQNLNIRVGYNIPLDNYTNNNSLNIQGFNMGANYDFMLTEKFSIRPGLYYLMQWPKAYQTATKLPPTAATTTSTTI